MAYIANKPSRELVDLVARLKGQWHGDYALCVCPAHADSDPSLSIRQGDRGILVNCFAGCDTTAILAALGNPAVPGRAGPNPPGRDYSEYARRIWEESGSLCGTIAKRYLQGRALPTDLPDLRFHPDCPRKGGAREPALVAGITDNHKIICIHRIFLKPDGSWHTGKQMLGRPRQSAWRSATPTTKLGLAEGVEDAAAFYKWTGIPCWSGLSSGNLQNVAIPHEVEELYIAYDEGDAGEKVVERLTGLHGSDRRVIPVSPRPCSDWAAKGVWLERRGRAGASNEGASDDKDITPDTQPR